MAAVAADPRSAIALALERVSPARTPRGTVLVLPGRGDDPSYYRRLAARLAADGYAVDIASAPATSAADVAAAWSPAGTGAHDDLDGRPSSSGAPAAEGVHVVLGVDSSAGFAATALAEGLLDPAPAGAVFAGTALPGAAVPDGDDLAARSACPLHRGVVLAADAPRIADSGIAPVWPATPAGLPVLALHGGADEIAPAGRVADLYEGWRGELVTVRGGLHDVLNDVHHRSVAAEIVAFLERLRLDEDAAPVLERTPIPPLGPVR